MTGSPPRLGVALGTIGLPANEWLDLAGALAQLPITRVWIWDHLMGRGAPERPVLEALTLASAALARHPTLCVGTLVLDVTKRPPALVAKSVATITSFAPGRLLIGLGAGGDAAEHQALGIPYGSSGERLEQLADYVAIFRTMLEGDPTARVTRAAPSGRVALDGAASSPRPKERVPLYIAGDHPESILLAATEGDGWIAPVTTFAAGITRLREEERRSGRAAGSVSAVALQELGRDEPFAETPFGSSPDAWLAEQRAAGADEVIITVRSPRDVAALSAMMHA